jgi:hypothetical protein
VVVPYGPLFYPPQRANIEIITRSGLESNVLFSKSAWIGSVAEE